MPTVLRVQGHRFFFLSNEGREPPRIHIERGEAYTKFWIEPVSLAAAHRFRAHELNELDKIVEKHQELLLERWHEHFRR